MFDLNALLEDIKAKVTEAYNQGVIDGKASVGGGFTQADIDAAVAVAVAPLNEKVSALQAQVDAFPALIAEAVAAAKAELKVSFKALIVAEDQHVQDAVDAL